MMEMRNSSRSLEMVSKESIAGWHREISCDSCDEKTFDDQILCDFLKVKVTPVICREICTPEISQFPDFM